MQKPVFFPQRIRTENANWDETREVLTVIIDIVSNDETALNHLSGCTLTIVPIIDSAPQISARQSGRTSVEGNKARLVFHIDENAVKGKGFIALQRRKPFWVLLDCNLTLACNALDKYSETWTYEKPLIDGADLEWKFLGQHVE